MQAMKVKQEYTENLCQLDIISFVCILHKLIIDNPEVVVQEEQCLSHLDLY